MKQKPAPTIPRYAYDLDKLSFVKHPDGGWVRYKDHIQRNAEPCEWEIENNKIIEDKIEHVMKFWKFCPACGRKLEAP